MSIAVTPYGGLCNRLRVIFSYLTQAQQTQPHKTLYVDWTRHPHVSNAEWQHVFEPIPGVVFQRKVKSHKTNTPFKSSSVGYKEWTPLVAEFLKPVAAVQRRIDAAVQRLGINFIAVHARRTDHTKLATGRNVFTTDEQYFAWIDALPSDMSIFVASDNPATWQHFKRRYGERAMNTSQFRSSPGGTGRHTSLQDAVVDMFVCAAATHFKGSGYSSFSGAINWLRQKKLQTFCAL